VAASDSRAARSGRARSKQQHRTAPAASGSTTGTMNSSAASSLPALPFAPPPRSAPSTWSEPVSAWARSAITRISAVIAKLITIAVSTSACGSGSAYAGQVGASLPSTIRRAADAARGRSGR